ncbi:hypothetical protein Baya_7088 [Bagarius yarrelli]|uniref:Uncharacterized protein n=1 Tax=Bagarius yarrelli TaxID=175774 RepID=A0A556TZ83_BAGYA|nr:hypothetical protein Baya_7088 [Bagarius yarrelli]
MQRKWLDRASKDLHWLNTLGRLPVRERQYRHGSCRTPMCLLGCHVVATRFWRVVVHKRGTGTSPRPVLYSSVLACGKRLVAKCVLWGMRVNASGAVPRGHGDLCSGQG